MTVSEADVDEVLAIIGDAFTGEGMQQVNDEDDPAGEGISSMQRQSSLDVDITAASEGLVTITITENVGQGESQALP